MTVEKWRDRFDNNIEAWRFLITQNQNLQEEATYMRCPKGQLLFQQIFFLQNRFPPILNWVQLILSYLKTFELSSAKLILRKKKLSSTD